MISIHETRLRKRETPIDKVIFHTWSSENRSGREPGRLLAPQVPLLQKYFAQAAMVFCGGYGKSGMLGNHISTSAGSSSLSA